MNLKSNGFPSENFLNLIEQSKKQDKSMQASIISDILLEFTDKLSLSPESWAFIRDSIQALSPDMQISLIHDIGELIQGVQARTDVQKTLDSIADTLIRASTDIPKDTVTWKTVNEQNRKRDIINARIVAAEMLGLDMREYDPRDHLKFGHIMDRFRK